MTLKSRIDNFAELGIKLKNNTNKFVLTNQNTWFISQYVENSILELSNSLKKENLEKWVSMYQNFDNQRNSKKVGIIMAGNIPLVGFHDFLSILITGNKVIGKLSSKDDVFMRILVEMLIEINPEFKNLIRFEDSRLTDFDAVIATGSNNSSRYFEYYFGKYPHIIRKNRNSVAVLTGQETDKELQFLADDIFMYFGLGCRNVSKLYLPNDYDLKNIFENCNKYKFCVDHNKYSNNYGYNRSIYLMNNITFWDNNFMLLTQNTAFASPVSVVYFERYTELEQVKNHLNENIEHLQCIVSSPGIISNSLKFGETQKPNLWDYADNVDTIKFLTEL